SRDGDPIAPADGRPERSGSARCAQRCKPIVLGRNGHAGCEMFFNKQQDLPQRRAPHAEACALPAQGARLELNTPKLQPRSLIDRSANMIGDLWSEGDVQIDGHLCGNINCAQLLVGKDAVITGVVIAQEAVIRGKMTGLIRATRVLLQASARVESEII